MTEETGERETTTPEQEAPIPFKQFLEAVHPSIEKQVSGVWQPRQSPAVVRMLTPDLHLHCPGCDGKRTFRCSEDEKILLTEKANGIFARYLCGDCRASSKEFSLQIRVVGRENGEAAVYKYGEIPPFGVPAPQKVLRLFGGDSGTFLRGRQCENQGLGIGAFAYYRRVVESHTNEIFDEIIKVCEAVGAPQPLIEELGSAKQEMSFTKAMKQIKTALPQGLLIRGRNPLLALHNALSIGLHSESDAMCLEAAHDVRLVLTDLVEKMSLLRQDDSELHDAVQRLIAKKGCA